MDLKTKLKVLPDAPGCYLMKDENDRVIYVGKAKNLKKRVRSYFIGAHNERTTLLVSEIRDFSFVVTNSEHESLILELNLIKEHVPKYNIKLADDKTYPYIEITEERYPRLRVVRKKRPSGRLFGPYPNVYGARETVRLLNRLYPLRKCDKLPNKECLYYHIGQCLAPCIHPDVDFDLYIREITRFLKGDTKEVLDRLHEEMEEASSSLSFEKAAEYRDMIGHIEQTTKKQVINVNDYKDRDAVGYAHDVDDVALQILMMRQGKIVDHHHVVFSYVGEPMESALSYLQQYYESVHLDEILFDGAFALEDVSSLFDKAFIPQRGPKKKLVDLAHKNAVHDLEHHHEIYRHRDERIQEALSELSAIIGRKVERIEAFDNAQLYGTAPISAMVVYENGFAKNDYRKYHLRTTTNDDYQAMREVTYRRYQRLLLEEKRLPDLVVVDGGLGQVRAAASVLSELMVDLPVAGLKKNSVHQLEALIYQEKSYALLKHSPLYKLLGKLSEEVHRFAIAFHRKTRKKSTTASPLDRIPGIGPKRKRMLLEHFATMEELKKASEQELKDLGLPESVITAIKEATS
ncbi:MAG: excinuclease ABC subunit UvrC [Acholeplasmataceae bacterium]